MDNLHDAYAQEFAARLPQLAGHDLPWLTRWRQVGLEYFLQQGLPTSKHESWKYTPLSLLNKQHLPAAIPLANLTAVDDKAILAATASHRLVFIDGVYQPQLAQLGALPKGVILTNLASAYSQPAAVNLLGLHAKAQHGFAALNQAFSQDGLFLYIPDGKIIEQPIEIVCVNTQPNCTVYLRHFISAGKQSKATVVENYSSTGQQLYLNNCMTESVLHEGAELNHYKLQQEAETAAHIGAMHAHQHAHSICKAYSFNLGGKLARSDTQMTLAGSQAECHLTGLYLARGRQHSEQHTETIHQQPQTFSQEYYKGILDGYARGVFNGRIEVQQAAQKTDAQLKNKNLLLSSNAEIDTKPELEIYADDVKCSHGATVSQLDENALFYLRSRGMDTASAQSVLIYAFAAEILAGVAPLSLRKGLQQQLLKNLPITLAEQELL